MDSRAEPELPEDDQPEKKEREEDEKPFSREDFIRDLRKVAKPEE